MKTMNQCAGHAALVGILALAMGSPLTPAAAQSVAEDIADDADRVARSSRRSAGPREEIVVTTRKVEENLKDVPLSITAFDSGLIEAAGILNLQDVADLTPGLTFFNAFGENLPVPIIRGVSQTDIFGEPNAGIFIDGVYVAGREGLNFSQLDLERIEVVKGPQSAQYGRTAFAGAINYVTKRPSEEFESRVDGWVGNRGRAKIAGMVSGPIIWDSFRGRIAALYDDFDGTYDNADYPNVDIGGRTFRSYQGSLVWYPSDTFEIYASGYLSNDGIDEPSVYPQSANCENRIDADPTTVRYQNFCGEVPTLNNSPSPTPGLINKDTLVAVEDATGEKRDLTRGNLNIKWEPNFGSFSFLTGYSKTEQESSTDFGHIGDHVPFLYCTGASVEPPEVPNSCLGNPADQMFFTGVLNVNRPGDVEEWSQEIRFTSNQDQRLRYTIGGYAFETTSSFGDGNIQATGPLPNNGLGIGLPPFTADPGDPPNLVIGTAIFYCTFTDDGCLDPLERRGGGGNTRSWAAFSGVDFDITDRLIGRFELRYTQSRIEDTTLVYQGCDPTGDVVNCGDDFWDLRVPDPIPPDPDNPSSGSRTGSSRFDSVTGRVGLDFRLNDAWMMYGSVATGDKPGGIQLASPQVVTPGGLERETFVHTFDTESITAYELGLKGRTTDGRIGLDVAVFFNDWEDIVLRQIVEESPVSGRPLEQPTAFNFNAGTAEVWGFEMTADMFFTENFSGRFTVNWNDSTLTEAAQDTFETWPSFAPDGDVSGNKLLRQPEWTGSASLDYQRPVFGNWDGFARIDATYQDKIYIGNDNQSWLKSRTTANLRLGLESGRFSVAFWVRNLFDNGDPIAAFRDIFWSNTDSIFPPFDDLGPRPGFDKFVPLRYTTTYPSLRTYGLTVTARFGASAH